MITKSVKIGDNEVVLAADGSTPIRYTAEFHSDYYKDEMAVQDKGTTVFLSRVTYIMAKQADKNFKKGFLEWLGDFGVNDVALAAEDIMSLVADNLKTTSKAKKNQG